MREAVPIPLTSGPPPGSRDEPTVPRAESEAAVYCPECGLPAWVEWTATASSTDGPMEHVKVRCFARHWFLMPAERIS